LWLGVIFVLVCSRRFGFVVIGEDAVLAFLQQDAEFAVKEASRDVAAD
jgi:hypothetical protein